MGIFTLMPMWLSEFFAELYTMPLEIFKFSLIVFLLILGIMRMNIPMSFPNKISVLIGILGNATILYVFLPLFYLPIQDGYRPMGQAVIASSVSVLTAIVGFPFLLPNLLKSPKPPAIRLAIFLLCSPYPLAIIMLELVIFLRRVHFGQ